MLGKLEFGEAQRVSVWVQVKCSGAKFMYSGGRRS